MHVHGNYNVPTIPLAGAHAQTQALVQKRAEETRRKLAASAFALTGPGDGSRSGGQAQQQPGQRRRQQEEGEFEHLFSALG